MYACTYLWNIPNILDHYRSNWWTVSPIWVQPCLWLKKCACWWHFQGSLPPRWRFWTSLWAWTMTSEGFRSRIDRNLQIRCSTPLCFKPIPWEFKGAPANATPGNKAALRCYQHVLHHRCPLTIPSSGLISCRKGIIGWAPKNSHDSQHTQITPPSLRFCCLFIGKTCSSGHQILQIYNLPNKGPVKDPLGLPKGVMFIPCSIISSIFHTLGRSFNPSNHWQTTIQSAPIFPTTLSYPPLFRQSRHSSISTCPELSLSTILKTLSIKRRSSCKTPPAAPALKIRLLLPHESEDT